MEDKIELMPAADAIALTNKKAITIEGIAGSIKTQAGCGMRVVRLYDMMFPFDVMQQVMAAGYSVRQERGVMGENIIVISW